MGGLGPPSCVWTGGRYDSGPQARRKAVLDQMVTFISALPLQQAQHIFLRRVGLGQHGGRRLLQDLVFR